MKRLLCMLGLLLSAMLVLIFTAQTVLASNPQPSARQAVGQGDGPGRDVVLGDLPDLSAAALAGAKQVPFPRNPHMTDAQYQAAKAAASRDTAGARPQDAAHLMGPPIDPASALTTLTPGAFVDFFAQSEGCNGVGWHPSDMGLAVSSTYIVQVVNECLAVYNKSGGLLAGPKDLCGIFGLPANLGTHGCFDPRALYDAQANKFVVMASLQTSDGNAFILTASAANPTLTWHSHIIARGAGLADYPTLGQTAYLNNSTNSLITVCDNFTGGFSECLLLPKRGVYGTLGNFPVISHFTLGGIELDTLQPANSYELSDNPRAQYAINSLNFNGGDGFCGANSDQGVVVWAFSGATAGQTHFSVNWTGCGSTSTYRFAGNADNAGFCSACIETIDNRINSMVFYSQGVLFPTIDANNGGTSAVLGWRVHPYLDDNGLGCTSGVLCPALTAVTIEQEFCYDCGGGNRLEAYFGDIGPNPENDWTLFATFSSRGDFLNRSPGQFYASNRVSWLTPFHDAGTFSCQNNAAYNPGNEGRWGDYAAAAPDDPGSNPSKIAATWGSGMYVQATGNWGTCIAAVHPQDGP